MSILTDRCTIKPFYRGGKSNGQDWRVAVKSVVDIFTADTRDRDLKMITCVHLLS